jgi:hypothetical protein
MCKFVDNRDKIQSRINCPLLSLGQMNIALRTEWRPQRILVRVLAIVTNMKVMTLSCQVPPRCMVFLDQFIITQPAKTFPAFTELKNFIIAFVKSRH